MTNDAVMPPLAATDQRVFRLIASIYPTILLFEQVTEPEDLDDIYALEAMTNERLRQETGDISLVPLEDRVVGPGSSPIMAAFTHLNRDGARFSDASFGAYPQAHHSCSNQSLRTQSMVQFESFPVAGQSAPSFVKRDG